MLDLATGRMRSPNERHHMYCHNPYRQQAYCRTALYRTCTGAPFLTVGSTVSMMYVSTQFPLAGGSQLSCTIPSCGTWGAKNRFKLLYFRSFECAPVHAQLDARNGMVGGSWGSVLGHNPSTNNYISFSRNFSRHGTALHDRQVL